jgi:hypothetical protein
VKRLILLDSKVVSEINFHPSSFDKFYKHKIVCKSLKMVLTMDQKNLILWRFGQIIRTKDQNFSKLNALQLNIFKGCKFILLTTLLSELCKLSSKAIPVKRIVYEIKKSQSSYSYNGSLWKNNQL